MEVCELFGVKARRRSRLSRYVQQFHLNETMQALSCHLEETVRQRIAQRRTVSVPWLHRIGKQRVRELADAGIHVTCHGKYVACSRTWVHRWLCIHGYISRRRGKTRKTSPEQMAASMLKWLHFCRTRVFKRKLDLAGVASSSGSGIVDMDVELPEKRRKRASRQPRAPNVL